MEVLGQAPGCTEKAHKALCSARSPPTPTPVSRGAPSSPPACYLRIRNKPPASEKVLVMAGTGIVPAANGDKKPAEEFDPSRMMGIIKRKALIKELAAAYHADCVERCKELMQLQRKWEEEQHAEAKMPEELKMSAAKPSKRRKR